jgi:hypothetical protein
MQLAAVLPWASGTYCSIEYMVPNNRFDPSKPVHVKRNAKYSLRSHRVDTLNEAINFLTYLLGRADVRDVYFSTAPLTQMKLIEPDASKGQTFRPFQVPLRTQGTEAPRNSLVVDLDVKENAYPDTGAAIDALSELIAEFGLPSVTALVFSGTGGAHAYFLLETPVNGAAWQWMADALCNALRQKQIKCDLSVTENSVGLLRVAGTYNFKHVDAGGDKLPVSLVLYRDARIPNDVMAAALEPFRVAPKIVVQRAAPAEVNPLSAGLDFNFVPRDLDDVAQHCPWIAQSLADGGVDNGHDLQRSAARVAYFCNDSEDALRRLIENRKSIAGDELAIADIYTEIVNEKDAGKWNGFPRCQTIYREGATVCGSCPHKAHRDSGGSPLNVASKRLQETKGYWQYFLQSKAQRGRQGTGSEKEMDA